MRNSPAQNETVISDKTSEAILNFGGSSAGIFGSPRELFNRIN